MRVIESSHEQVSRLACERAFEWANGCASGASAGRSSHHQRPAEQRAPRHEISASSLGPHSGLPARWPRSAPLQRTVLGRERAAGSGRATPARDSSRCCDAHANGAPAGGRAPASGHLRLPVARVAANRALISGAHRPRAPLRWGPALCRLSSSLELQKSAVVGDNYARALGAPIKPASQAGGPRRCTQLARSLASQRLAAPESGALVGAAGRARGRHCERRRELRRAGARTQYPPGRPRQGPSCARRRT